MKRIRIILAAIAATGTLALGHASAFDGYERWVRVRNVSDQAIMSVQISDIDRPTFGPDLLGPNVIPAFGRETVEPRLNRGYCRFDIRVTFEDDKVVDLSDVNLCEVTQIDVGDRGYTRVAY